MQHLINLNEIELDLIWVNFKRDKTNRKVTLQQISNMDHEQRRQLHFIKDFKNETIKWISAKDLTIERHEINTKECENVGFIYFSNTDRCGVFYETVCVIHDELEFDAIKAAYYTKINS